MIMPHLDEIGRNVVRLRKAQGLTQEQVAFHSNISISRLQDIEYGCQNGTRLLIVLRLRVALKFYHTDEYAEKTYNFYYCLISH